MKPSELVVLRRIRQEKLRLRQSDMATVLGVSTRVYSNIEAGERPLKESEMEVLEKYLLERGINFSDEQSKIEPDSAPISVTISVTKTFTRISEEQIREVTAHLDALRALGGGWSVTCGRIVWN